MEEIWKQIDRFDGFYEVSSHGRIKSVPHRMSNGKGFYISSERILKPNVLPKGYLQVTLSDANHKRRSLQVHRIVASAFVRNPQPSRFNQVNHKDGNKQNNVYSNLEWTDNSGNQIHAWATGLQVKHNCGWGTSRHGVGVAVLDDDGNVDMLFETLAEAARFYGEKTGSNVGKSIKHNWKFHGRKVVRI